MYHQTARRTVQKIILILGLLSSSVFVFGVVRTHALEESNIETTFSSDLSVNADNTADVTINVAFENVDDTPTILTSYDLFIGDVLPQKIVAVHNEEELDASVYESRGSVIRVGFGESLLRDGDVYEFNVNYQVENFLHQSGGAYDVELPLFRSSETARVSRIQFSYSSLYGPVNYASASFTQSDVVGGYRVVFSDLDGVERLYLSLGTQRRFGLTIERSFQNTGDGYIQQIMLIPPDTRSQELLLTSVSEFPTAAVLTDEKNYVLTYDVPSNDELWVRMQGMLIEKVPQEGSMVLTPAERDTYLDTRSPLWRFDEAGTLIRIEKMVEELTGDDLAKVLYDYTLDELILSDSFRELHGSENRKGAEVALKTYKNASVEDYADVFVALCRYFEVPSRIVAGYVFPYSVSGSSLGMFHVWPQYWSDTYGWVSVDPAYEAYTDLPQRDYVGLQRVIVALSYDNTTFESYPETTEDIMITNETVAPATKVATEVNLPDVVQSGGFSEGLLLVRNEGNGMFLISSVSAVETNGLDVTFGDMAAREVVLPGEEISYVIYIRQPDWYVSGSRELMFQVVSELPNGTQRINAEAEVQVEPLWWLVPLSWFITVLAFVLTFGAVWSGAKIGSKVMHWFRK